MRAVIRIFAEANILMRTRIVRLLLSSLLLGCASAALVASTTGPWSNPPSATPIGPVPSSQAAPPPAGTRVFSEERLGELVALLTEVIEQSLEQYEIPAISIALVDDQQTLWAAGFGAATPGEERTAPRSATADTVYRVGSVSKLFTDLAVMKLVERGVLDLDAPVQRYLPDFAPRPVAGEPDAGSATTPSISLRQLMCHRAGLVREPPIGHYFDPAEPSLSATVASLNQTRLVAVPGAITKYSNAGLAVVGLIVERVGGRPFAEFLRDEVLAPLGLFDSAFVPREDLVSRLAAAQMWTHDGRRFPAPSFQLGMAPAGSMYSTAGDLALFASALFRGGVVIGGASLAEMWRPQFPAADSPQPVGYGLGFRLGRLAGLDVGVEHRRVGHGGAIYGFSTELGLLPDEKLGVVVTSSLDFTNGVVTQIADLALRGLLALEQNRPFPKYEVSDLLPPGVAERFVGRYEFADSEDLVLHLRHDRLFAELGGLRRELRLAGGRLIVDDRFGRRDDLTIDLRSGVVQLVVNGNARAGVRVASDPPVGMPPEWRDLLGEYGWDHNTLYVLEDGGELRALVEWFESSPLTPLGKDEFALPLDRGLYQGELLVFERGPRGEVVAARLGGVRFARRQGGIPGMTFRIEPRLSMKKLRRLAARARPPAPQPNLRSPDLVELSTLDPGIHFDVRYATTNNFMGQPFYEQARAFLQRPAAEALQRAHRSLAGQGYGLLIHDGYRPWRVTKMFWDATPESQRLFVADPSQGSRHNRGCAVDLTLYDLTTGQPVEMTSGYDEFSERAYPEFPGGTSLQREHRDVLRSAMEAEGFAVYEWEWWHFDYQDWRLYPILDRSFAEIAP